MQDIVTPLRHAVPTLIGALAILIIGYLVALVVGAVVRGVARRSGLDRRLAPLVVGPERAGQVDAAPALGRLAFWLVMLFVLVAFFQQLSLTLVTRPLDSLLTLVFAYIPLLIGAGVLILVAWIIATILRTLLLRALPALRLDERLSGGAGVAPPPGRPVTRSLAEAAYWLVFLLFLPAILGALGLTGLLRPVQVLLDELLGFLPHLFAAAVLLLIGWFVARLVRQIVTNLLAATGLDRVGARVGLANPRLSDLIGLVVYVLILLPIAIAALDALQLGAITAPASAMLLLILAAIPKIFAAALTVAIAYLIGRVLAGIVTSLLAGMGIDALPGRLGVAGAFGGLALSSVLGRLVLVALVLFAVIEALQVLGFVLVAVLTVEFVRLAGHILLGLLILAIGLYLARAAARGIRASGVANAGLLAGVAQGAILVLAGAMGLREMGVAPEIITLAFGLLLGALAVASAIAFGVGGRHVAGRVLERYAEQRGLVSARDTAAPPLHGGPEQPPV